MIVQLELPFSQLWQGKDAFVEVEKLQGVEYRAVAGRRTFRTEVAERGYFVKIHRGIGWREIFKDLFSLRLPILGARNEFDAVALLARLGVPSMHAVAYGERGSNPARQQSFLITEELAPTLSLDLAWSSTELALTRRQRVCLISQVASMTRRMHQAGLNHRDLYLCHFLLHTDSPGDAFKLSVIDLHRAQIRETVPRRWRDKDLAALYFSALECNISGHDCLRFLRDYFECSVRDVLTIHAPLVRAMLAEGKRLKRRYVKKYMNQIAAPGGM